MDSSGQREKIHHPRVTANPLSILTFSWTFPLFRIGFKRDIDAKDLYSALKEHQSHYLGDKLELLWDEELEQAKTKKKKPSFLKVLVKLFGAKVFFYGILIALSELIFKITQPLFMGGLIRYFAPNSDMSIDTAYLYVACIVMCSVGNVLCRQSYLMAMLHIGMKIRVAVCSLVYRKVLKLSIAAMRQTTVGQSINLMSNDVNRFDHTAVLLVYLWVGPLQTLILLYLMWREIGFAALIGVSTILLVIPIQAGFGRMLSVFRLRTAKRTDERIRFMNEIIVGIQVIKMYAWEKPFAHLVSLARRREIRAVRFACYVRGLFFSFEKFSAKIAIFASIVTYAAIGNDITAEKMFVVTGFVNILIKAMTEFFPRSLAQISEGLVSVGRIQKFLLNDEVTESTVMRKTVGSLKYDGKEKLASSDIEIENFEDLNFTKNKPRTSKTQTIGIRVSDVTAKWSEDLNENALTNVSLDVKPGGLVAIIGPVGSGKTSLLNAILKELPIKSGSIMVGGTISYACQEPWLFAGSVQQNILFGQPMNLERYKKVVSVCALKRDFELLPHGDKSIVGDRGITLSGGQRARINLARAIYKEADLYILDDPLSAVDTHVGRHLFEDCICDFLKNKTRLLVTHQLQYLQAVDTILILNNGAVEAKGTYQELRESDIQFAKQLDLDDDLELPNTVTRTYSKSSLSSINRQNSETSQQSLDLLEPVKIEEMRKRGHVSGQVYQSYCSSSGSWSLVLIVMFITILSQVFISLSDYWMSFWSNVEERRALLGNGTYSNSSDLAENYTYNITLDYNDTVTPDVDLGWMPSTETCIYIYMSFIIGIIILTLSSSASFFTLCMRSSISLHNKMFNNIIHATMHFFTVHPSGQILNRFSKDMGAVDEVLPQTLQDCTVRMLMILGVVVIVSVINYWLLIPTVIMLFLFYLLRIYYQGTSRSIKRLEGVTRSPVFSHLNASLQGLTTIRAYGAQTLLRKEFDNHQDLHSSAYYLFLAVNRAFGLWLDSICCVYIALVAVSFLVLGGEKYGGDVGLAITQATMLTGLMQMGIRQMAELENQMTSVERVLEYTTVDKEKSTESSPDKRPLKDWPAKGVIIFDRVFLSYAPNEPMVLKNVNFSINSAEKVGIVGRTGAGKSSLITALFFLEELSDGCIKIDGIDVSSIGLHDLRSKISIIPQEPALFSGLLRENLDPFNEYSDAVLWSSLEEVELKQAVEELPAGLSHRVSEGGSNFSVGQRQLLCLARAIIRNNRILVLDEATANVDPQTDELIQATIRRKFADCTVLTIAHRLHTVIDSDRIIVMDAGSVVEFDHPYVLLKNKNGHFFKMVQETGHAMAESLTRTSQMNYENLKKKN